jgi:hypothetical protein
MNEVIPESNAIVRDEVMIHVTSQVGPAIVKYKHGLQFIVLGPEYQLLIHLHTVCGLQSRDATIFAFTAKSVSTAFAKTVA